MTVENPQAGPVGRGARLVGGICLAILAVPVYLEAGAPYIARSLALMLGLLVLYSALHWLISRYLRDVNPWLLGLVGWFPVFLVWFLGQGGGPLFGEGEGGTAAITFVGISLLVDVARADAGCEVMALPGLLFRERTHLPCLAFSPIDALERRGAED